MRLKRLDIRRFRSVKPGTVLEFSDGMNVILGQNGTGKTTLLELISLILRSDFSTLRNEAFDLSCVLELSDDVVLDLEVRGEPEPLPDLGEYGILELSRGLIEGAEPVNWRYQLSIRGKPESTVEVENGQVRRAPLESESKIPFDLYENHIVLNAAFHFRLFALLNTWRHSGGRFDESLGAFHDLVTPRETFEVIRSEVGFLPTTSLPKGIRSAFSEQLEKGEHPESLRFGAEDPLLARICSLFGLADLSVHPRFAGSGKIGREDTLEYKGFDLIATLDRATPPTRVSHDRLSFGQKRMISFLWQLACFPDAPIIADELVNGLHHSWVEACLEEIGERQAFIASQNPLLLDFLAFDTEDEVRRAFVLCDVGASEREDGSRAWGWRNLTSDEAASFWRAHQVGIQHVSEILRTKGLW